MKCNAKKKQGEVEERHLTDLELSSLDKITITGEHNYPNKTKDLTYCLLPTGLTSTAWNCAN